MAFAPYHSECSSSRFRTRRQIAPRCRPFRLHTCPATRFSVSRDEQRRRFEAREIDPLKQWKLSPIDRASLDKWDDYTEAKEAMFFYTDTRDAPWTIVKSDDKKRARLNISEVPDV